MSSGLILQPSGIVDRLVGFRSPPSNRRRPLAEVQFTRPNDTNAYAQFAVYGGVIHLANVARVAGSPSGIFLRLFLASTKNLPSISWYLFDQSITRADNDAFFPLSDAEVGSMVNGNLVGSSPGTGDPSSSVGIALPDGPTRVPQGAGWMNTSPSVTGLTKATTGTDLWMVPVLGTAYTPDALEVLTIMPSYDWES